MASQSCLKTCIWLIFVISIWGPSGACAQELFYEWSYGTSINKAEGPDRDGGREIITDAAGNVYVAGGFSGTIDLNPSEAVASFSATGADDWFLAKYDATGKYLWAFSAGGGSGDAVYSLALDQHDNVVVSGTFRQSMDLDPSGETYIVNANPSDPDAQVGEVFIAKYSPAGALVWGIQIGSEDSESCLGMEVDDNGDIYIVSSFNESTDFDPSSNVAKLPAFAGGGGGGCLAKYNSNGVYQWASPVGQCAIYALALDHAQGVYLSGSFRNATDFDPSANEAVLTPVGGVSDAFVAKYSSSGMYQWAFAIGSSSIDEAYDMFTDDVNNLYVTGRLSGSADFNPSPTQTATVTANGTPVTGSVAGTFVAKYSSAGEYIFAFGYNNIPVVGNAARAIVPGKDGTFYVGGTFSGSIDLDPGSQVFGFSATTSNKPAFLAHYTQDGQLITAWQWQAREVYINAVTRNVHNELLLTGRFWGSLDLDLSSAEASTSVDGTNDRGLFLVKYMTCAPTSITGQPVASEACKGSDVIFDVSVEGAGNYTFQWYKDDVAIADAVASILHIPDVMQTAEGVYDVEVLGGCETHSESVELNVVEPVSIVSAPEGLTITEGDPLVLQATVTGDDVNYTWKKGEAVLEETSSEYAIVHTTAADAGAYTITASNTCSTLTSAAAEVVVLPIVMGNEEDSSSNISYANPVKDAFTFSLHGAAGKPAEIIIYGPQGNITHQGRVADGSTHTVDTTQWPSGVYFFTAKSGAKTRKIKLIKP